MRNFFITTLLALATTSMAQQTVKLPEPDMAQQSMQVVQTLASRHSVRSFEATTLSQQELSNLCWAACGRSRDDKHLTAPTARNLQEIRLFVFTADGVFEYNPYANTLSRKADGDHRSLMASNGGAGFRQDFVMEAPVTLLMVIDFDKYGSNNQQALMMGCVDAGNVSENINLYCQSVGLATVPRATMDVNAIRALLGLSDQQLPIMNNPVGYEKGVDKFVAHDGTPVIAHCIKHGSLCLQIGDKWVYVDPVTDKVPPITDYTTMPKADYIIITHEHPDHLDAKAIKQLTKAGTVVVANPNSSKQISGVDIVMNNGDSQLFCDFTIDAVPAYNSSPDKQQFHPKGRDNGYVITTHGLRIYIAGDTEDISEMSALHDIDIAYLPCNLPFTMTPQQLAKAAKIIRPKVLFPYHYGQTDIQQVVNLLKNTPIDVRIRQYQ